MEKNTTLKPVQLPEGHMCRDCCADCDYSGERDSYSNKIKCGNGHGWVYPSDYCSEFRQRR